MDRQHDVITTEGALESSKILTTHYFNFLEDRVCAENRIKMLRDKGLMDDVRDLESLVTSYDMFEVSLKRTTDTLIKKFPIWDYFLCKPTSLDKTAALALIAGIGDIANFETPSKLWAYCGMHTYEVEVGTERRWFESESVALKFIQPIVKRRRERAKTNNRTFEEDVQSLLKQVVCGRGHIHKTISAKEGVSKFENWNKFLKKVCLKIGDDFVNDTTNCFYHQTLRIKEMEELQKISMINDHNFESYWLNDQKLRANLERQLPKGTLAKASARAMRETIRLFLSHVLQYWRQQRKLPTRKPRTSKGGELVAYPGMPLEFTIFQAER